MWPYANLQVDDVLVAVDGVEIGQDATVPLRGNERIHFSHLVTDELVEEIVLGDVRRSVRAARRYVDEIRGLYEDICELTNANGGEG